MNKKEFGFLLYKNNPTKFKEYFREFGNSVAEMIDKVSKQNLQQYFNLHWDSNEPETNKVLGNFVELYGPANQNVRIDLGAIGDWITGGSDTQTSVTETQGNLGVIIASTLAIAIVIGVVIWKMN